MSHQSGRKSIAERLDDGVRWTGLPYDWSNPLRRKLRWMSSIVLALGIAGFVMAFGQPRQGLGSWLLIMCFSLGNVLPVWGPIKPWGTLERADEFDRALRARAFLVALSVLAATAIIGLGLIVGLSLAQEWTDHTLRTAAMHLAFLLMVIYGAGPTCYASWTLRPVGDDDRRHDADDEG